MFAASNDVTASATLSRDILVIVYDTVATMQRAEQKSLLAKLGLISIILLALSTITQVLIMNISGPLALQPFETNPSPTPRQRGLAVAVGENIYYFGGTSAGYQELKESCGVVHIFNTTSHTWSIETTPPNNCEETDLQSAVVGTDIWVFSKNTWSCFDTVQKNWRQIGLKTNTHPSPEGVQSFAVIGDSIYYYDGARASLEQKVFRLNTVTREITTTEQEGFGEHPQERRKTLFAALSDETLLFYGPCKYYDAVFAKKFGEVLYYDLKEAKWARAIESLHEDPFDIDEYLYAGRVGSSMIFVPIGTNEKMKLRILDLEKLNWMTYDLSRDKQALISYATLVGSKVYCWLSNGQMTVIDLKNIPSEDEQRQIDQRLEQIAKKALSAINRPVEVPQEFSADPINIDTTLKPVDLQNIAVHSQMAPSFSKIFPYLEVSNITESTVPQSPSDNLLMHKNFMHYLTLAWFNHFSVVLSPDIIFYTILAEVADEILTEPDTYRHLFTDSFDKKIILTETSDPTKIDLEQVIAGIAQNTPVDANIFTANFSSSTVESRLAMQAAFCDAMSVYYSYLTTLCGIPRTKVLGTKQDWELLEHKIHRMRTEVFNKDATTEQKMSAYLQRAETYVRKIHTIRDPAFWKDMFTINRCSSGHTDVVEGWIVMFYRNGHVWKDLGKLCYEGDDFYHYKSHISTVKWSFVDTQRHFELKSGLLYSNIVTGESEEDKKYPWLEPQFAHVTVETNGSGKMSPETFKKYIEEQISGREKKLMLAAYDLLKDDPIEVVNDGAKEVDFRLQIVGRQIDAWKKKCLDDGVSMKTFDLTAGPSGLALTFYRDVTQENWKALSQLADKIIEYLKLDQGVTSVNLGNKLAMIEGKIIASFYDQDFGGWIEELKISGDGSGCHEKLAEFLLTPKSAKFRKLHIKSRDYDEYYTYRNEGLSILAAALRKSEAPLETFILDRVDNWEMAEAVYELCTREKNGLKHFEAAGGDSPKCEAQVLRGIANSKSLEYISVNDLGFVRDDVDGQIRFKPVLDTALSRLLMANLPLNPSLKTIKNWHYKLSPLHLSVALSIPSLRSLSGIVLEDLSFLAKTSNLERLQAKIPTITTENMKYLADLIAREDSPLESLEIRHAKLECGAGSALAKALANNKSLKTLDLNHVVITGASEVYDMMVAITDWLEQPDCKIENLDLLDIRESRDLIFWGENLRIILTGLAKNNKIKHLKLAAKLDLPELDLLTELIRTSTSLTHIKIESVDTNFTEEQKAPLVAAIKANQNLVEFVSYFTSAEESKPPIYDDY